MVKTSPQVRDALAFERIEVLDARERPLMHMPLAGILKQKLPFRLVILALYDAEARLILCKRPPTPLGFSGTWDLFIAIPLPGEAREDAALRTFASAIPRWEPPALKLIQTTAATPELPIQHTLFHATLPTGVHPESQERNAFLYVDADELAGLATSVPELLSPTLLWAASRGLYQKALPVRFDE